jgi:hypothetical protein
MYVKRKQYRGNWRMTIHTFYVDKNTPTNDSVLVSYSTCVAAYIGGTFYETSHKYSISTTAHIRRYRWNYIGYEADVKRVVMPDAWFSTLQAFFGIEGYWSSWEPASAQEAVERATLQHGPAIAQLRAQQEAARQAAAEREAKRLLREQKRRASQSLSSVPVAHQAA